MSTDRSWAHVVYRVASVCCRGGALLCTCADTRGACHVRINFPQNSMNVYAYAQVSLHGARTLGGEFSNIVCMCATDRKLQMPARPSCGCPYYCSTIVVYLWNFSPSRIRICESWSVCRFHSNSSVKQALLFDSGCLNLINISRKQAFSQ